MQELCLLKMGKCSIWGTQFEKHQDPFFLMLIIIYHFIHSQHSLQLHWLQLQVLNICIRVNSGTRQKRDMQQSYLQDTTIQRNKSNKHLVWKILLWSYQQTHDTYTHSKTYRSVANSCLFFVTCSWVDTGSNMEVAECICMQRSVSMNFMRILLMWWVSSMGCDCTWPSLSSPEVFQIYLGRKK